jgi:hypothetical protein
VAALYLDGVAFGDIIRVAAFSCPSLTRKNQMWDFHIFDFLYGGAERGRLRPGRFLVSGFPPPFVRCRPLSGCAPLHGGRPSMNLTFRPVVWVTLEKAAEYTGRSVDSFRHLIRDGKLVEGTHWKWSPDNRQHVNLEGYDQWVANSNSKGSARGRRPSSSTSGGTASGTGRP